MSKKVTRRQIRSWLSPMRSCFAELKTGEVDCLRGYPVTRLDHADEYARIDHCIAGFRALIARLCQTIDCTPIERVEKKLAAGAPLTVEEIDSALSLLKRCEDELIRHTREEITSAVRTEQICIELDALEIRKAA